MSGECDGIIALNKSLQSILSYLNHCREATEHHYEEWQIRPVLGGANNLLYRITSSQADLAVKFTIRDNRQRAWREYHALMALAQQELPIAPQPVLLDMDNYTQPVVVQTWLEGDVVAEPPTQDAEWQLLLESYVALYQVRPETTRVSLQPAVINANSIDACRRFIQNQLALLPTEKQPTALHALIARLEESFNSEWPVAPTALCHVDGNTLNFVRQPERWVWVDWENSGWGDPVFEIGDLMTHPAYLSVQWPRWQWVVHNYCEMIGDPRAAERIDVYYKTMLVFWVIRALRYMHEIPAGLDQRLVEPKEDWLENIRTKYEQYRELAEIHV